MFSNTLFNVKPDGMFFTASSWVCGLLVGFNNILILASFSNDTLLPLASVKTINKWNSSSNSFSFCLSPNLPPLNTDNAPVIKPDTGVLINTIFVISALP